MESYPLIPIGSKIKVSKSKIKTLLPKKIIDNLPQTINGKVIDYKMTDGMGIGYVLITEKNHKIWVFNHELNEETKKVFNIPNEKRLGANISIEIFLDKYGITYDLNGSKKIDVIINPINLFKWIIYTLKDIF